MEYRFEGFSEVYKAATLSELVKKASEGEGVEYYSRQDEDGNNMLVYLKGGEGRSLWWLGRDIDYSLKTLNYKRLSCITHWVFFFIYRLAIRKLPSPETRELLASTCSW